MDRENPCPSLQTECGADHQGSKRCHGRTDGFGADDYPALFDFLKYPVCQHLLVQFDEVFLPFLQAVNASDRIR
jgi:hypothetical protein